MFRVIVAGGRDFSNYTLMQAKLDKLLANKGSVVIISGTARGADRLGERYARERGLKVEQHPADWDAHGRGAGYRRNETMAENADALVAFNKYPDGTSGTNHMIRTAKERGLQVRVVWF